MGVGNSGGWGINRGVGDVVYSSYLIIFGIDDKYNIGSPGGSFNGLNDGKLVVSYIDEPLE